MKLPTFKRVTDKDEYESKYIRLSNLISQTGLIIIYKFLQSKGEEQEFDNYKYKKLRLIYTSRDWFRLRVVSFNRLVRCNGLGSNNKLVIVRACPYGELRKHTPQEAFLRIFSHELRHCYQFTTNTNVATHHLEDDIEEYRGDIGEKDARDFENQIEEFIKVSNDGAIKILVDTLGRLLARGNYIAGSWLGDFCVPWIDSWLNVEKIDEVVELYEKYLKENSQ